MATNGVPNPVDYPSVEIGGVSYFLKYTAGAQLRMEKLGYTPEKMRDLFVYEKAEDGSEKIVATRLPVTVAFAWVSACAGQIGRNGRWKPIDLSPEEIADLIPMSDFQALSASLTEAFLKAKPEGTNPATPPASQPETENSTGLTS